MQRRLRIAHHILGLCITGRTHGHAEARRQKPFTTVDRERRKHFLEQAIGNDLCMADRFQAVEQDGEIDRRRTAPQRQLLRSVGVSFAIRRLVSRRRATAVSSGADDCPPRSMSSTA